MIQFLTSISSLWQPASPTHVHHGKITDIWQTHLLGRIMNHCSCNVTTVWHVQSTYLHYVHKTHVKFWWSMLIDKALWSYHSSGNSKGCRTLWQLMKLTCSPSSLSSILGTAGYKIIPQSKQPSLFLWWVFFHSHTHTISIHYMVAIPLFWSYKNHEGKAGGDLTAEDDTQLFHHSAQQLCGHFHQNIYKHWGWADAWKGRSVFATRMEPGHRNPPPPGPCLDLGDNRHGPWADASVLHPSTNGSSGQRQDYRGSGGDDPHSYVMTVDLRHSVSCHPHHSCPTPGSRSVQSLHTLDHRLGALLMMV